MARTQVAFFNHSGRSMARTLPCAAPRSIEAVYRPIGALCCCAPARAGQCSSMTTTPRTAEITDFEMVQGTHAALSLLAGKWSVDVLYLLASGTRRYSEVLYEVGEISKKTLTQTLRGLERDGLIARRVIADMPVRVEYSLTPLGWSITGPLMAMYEWAAEHLSEDSLRMAA
jgi:DNA-binding HxlR family transcriptional regulator